MVLTLLYVAEYILPSGAGSGMLSSPGFLQPSGVSDKIKCNVEDDDFAMRDAGA